MRAGPVYCLEDLSSIYLMTSQPSAAQILNKRSLRRDLLRVDAELLDDDVLNFLFDRFFRHKICSVSIGCAWEKLKPIRAQDGK